MNKKLKAIGATLIGTGAFLGSYFGLKETPTQNPVTDIYRINIDESLPKEIQDDYILGFENGNTEIYLRDTKGKFNNIEDLRANELEDQEKSKSTRLETEKTLLEKKLNGYTETKEDSEPIEGVYQRFQNIRKNLRK